MKRIVVFIFMLGCLSGCYAHKKTDRSEKTVLFPLFAVTQDFKLHENGQVAKHSEKGNILLLASWVKDFEYDSEGVVVRRDEKSVLFPLWATHETEDQTRKNKKGSIMFLINYDEESEK